LEAAIHTCVMNTVAATSVIAGKAEPLDPATDTPPVADFSSPVVVNARGLALGILAALASLFAVYWAEPFLVPLLLGIVLAYTLNPLVAWLEAIKVPRVAGTTIVMAAVIAALVFGTYSLRGEMQAIIAQLPEAAQKVAAAIKRVQIGQPGDMQKLQNAATEVARATSQATSLSADGLPALRQPITRVVVEPPAFKFGAFLWEGSMGAIVALSQAVMVVFLVFFLLLGGDRFKRKLVQLTGPTLSNKKITVHILDGINESIQKYMFMLLATNVLVGLLSWIAFRWIGLENAGAWAVAAGFLHLVPYLGPGLTAAATGMAAFMQFETFSTAVLVAGASMAIATFVGTFVTAWMIGRIAKVNAAAVFISLLFWGWLWGVWGLLLSIPIIVIVKVVSQHVGPLHPLAELLGD
jgi:predicted PurR-regulated permease PerM